MRWKLEWWNDNFFWIEVDYLKELFSFHYIEEGQTKRKIMTLFLIVLPCMASPVNDCFRYYAPVAASTPALLLLLFGNISEMDKEQVNG